MHINVLINFYLPMQGSPQAGVDSLFEPLSPETDFFDMPNDGINDEVRTQSFVPDLHHFEAKQISRDRSYLKWL